MDNKKAMQLLGELSNEIIKIEFKDEARLDKFLKRANMIIRQIYGEKSPYLEDFNALNFYSPVAPVDEVYERKCWESGKNTTKNMIDVMIEEISSFKSNSEKTIPDEKRKMGKEIFIVHGHDEALKQTVARVIEKLDLKPIILHEQPSKGKTVIEKFELHSNVSIAIVLLTPDDVGRAKNEDNDNLRPRARQNVILELDFFIGKLGRNNVIVLHKEEEKFEMPSDYAGVVFIPIDSRGNWELCMVKELKGIGIDVDANKLM